MLAGRALDVEKLEISAMTFGIAQAAVVESFNRLTRAKITTDSTYDLTDIGEADHRPILRVAFWRTHSHIVASMVRDH